MKTTHFFSGSFLLLSLFAVSFLAAGSSLSAQEERRVSHILVESKAKAGGAAIKSGFWVRPLPTEGGSS